MSGPSSLELANLSGELVIRWTGCTKSAQADERQIGPRPRKLEAPESQEMHDVRYALSSLERLLAQRGNDGADKAGADWAQGLSL